MKDIESKDRNLVALGLAGAIFAAFLLIYYLPRSSQLRVTRESITALTGVRQDVALLLPLVAQTALTTPEPPGKVAGWVSDAAMPGLDQTKQVVANDGYMEGKGAKVKLRRLSPEQATQFLAQLTKVRLVTERMTLQDSDGDGRWDLEIDLKVPAAK